MADILRFLRYDEVYGKRSGPASSTRPSRPRPATSPRPTSPPPRPPARTASPSSSCSAGPRRRWANLPPALVGEGWGGGNYRPSAPSGHFPPQWGRESLRVIRVIYVRAVVRLIGDAGFRDHVLLIDPAPQVDQAAALGTEGEGRQIVERGDLVTAGTESDSVLGSWLALGAGCGGLGRLGSRGTRRAGRRRIPRDFVASVAGFSAWAAFLYDSLR